MPANWVRARAGEELVTAVRVWLVVVLAACIACSSAPEGGSKTPKAPRTPRGSPALSGPAGLPAVTLAEVANPDTELLFARGRHGGLLVAQRGNEWLAGPISLGPGSAVRATDAKRGLQPVASLDAARPVGERPRSALVALGDGYILSWVDGGRTSVWVLELDARGVPRGKAVSVTTGESAIAWLGIVSGSGAGYVLWETKSSNASQLRVATLSSGTPRATTITKAAHAWHPSAGPRGLAVAYVTDVVGERGRVELIQVEKDGSVGKAVRVSADSSAQLDVQVAATRDGAVVAWTDSRRSETRVLSAFVDGSGTVVGPEPAVPPVGSAALLTLVPSSDHERALVAWQTGAAPPLALGRAQLGVLDGHGRPTAARAEVWMQGPRLPHIVADGNGWATLTLAPMLRDEDATAPDDHTVRLVPSYVRLDASLDVRGAGPVRIDALAAHGGVPLEVGALDCSAQRCTLVAKSEGTPQLLLLVELPASAHGYKSAATKLQDAGPPVAKALESLADTDAPIAEVVAARLRDGRTLVAWVTHVGAESSSEPAPAAATLGYRFISEQGALGEAQFLSRRAVSAGGVSVAALEEPTKGKDDAVAVIAWAGPDAGSTQVYLTRLDARGKKASQKTITKIRRAKRGPAPNDVYDIEVVADGQGGVVVGWSDAREGNLGIYVARVDRQLEKHKPELRISSNGKVLGPGATEVTLASAGERVLVAWSEARDGHAADVYTALLSSALEPVATARAMDVSPGHSRTPRWVGGPGARALVWIDEPVEGGDGGALRMVAIGDGTEPTTAVRRITMAGRVTITSATVGCERERCRGVVTGAGATTLHLAAFDASRESGAPLTARSLATLSGVTHQDMSLSAADSAVTDVFFARDVASGGEVQRLSIGW